MEQSSLSRRGGLEEKIPELERTLEMIKLLILKKVRLFPYPYPILFNPHLTI
jgi:hypothetical protein